MKITTKETYKMSTRQRVGYTLVRCLGGIQEQIYNHVIKDRVWRSADGTCVPVKLMSSKHLENAYQMLAREDSVKNREWISRLRAELNSRKQEDE